MFVIKLNLKNCIVVICSIFALPIHFGVYLSDFQSVSPGVVETEIFDVAECPEFLVQMKQQKRVLAAKDVADAVLYVLSTPPHVQVQIIYVFAHTRCITNLYFPDS